MWFFRKKKRLTIEYNALEHSIEKMRMFEEKYHINSLEVYEKTCDFDIFEGNDRYYWETYIRNYIRCGGVLEDF